MNRHENQFIINIHKQFQQKEDKNGNDADR